MRFTSRGIGLSVAGAGPARRRVRVPLRELAVVGTAAVVAVLFALAMCGGGRG